MGIKRLNRSRLYNVEKKGLDVKGSIGISDAMRPALANATQMREGYKVTTDMVFDFGAAAANLSSQSAGPADPIGIAGGTDVSYLCKLAPAVFGNITTVETVALEQMSDGSKTDFDLMYGDADGYIGTDAGNDSTLSGGDTSTNIFEFVGLHKIYAYDNASTLANKYLYVTAGSATEASGSATITVTADNADNFVTGVTGIRLRRNNAATGTDVWFYADKGTGHGGGGTDGILKLGGSPNKAQIVEAIKKGIDANSNFNARVDGDNIIVDHTTLTANGNQDNLLNEAAPLLAGLTVGNFTGAMPSAVASGKLLVRVTGFMEPSDL